jgi:hypothetical protein
MRERGGEREREGGREREREGERERERGGEKKERERKRENRMMIGARREFCLRGMPQGREEESFLGCRRSFFAVTVWTKFQDEKKHNIRALQCCDHPQQIHCIVVQHTLKHSSMCGPPDSIQTWSNVLQLSKRPGARFTNF